MKPVLIHSQKIQKRTNLRALLFGLAIVALAALFFAPAVAMAGQGVHNQTSGLMGLFSILAGAVGMQLIQSASHANGQVIFYLPEGKYAGLFVRMAGTNAAAVTLDLTELGTMRITHLGTEIFNTRPSNLISRTNLYFGTPESASVAGGAYAYSWIVPFRKKLDELNILPVTSPKSTQFSLQGFNTADVASGTIEVYALYSDEGQASYVPMFKEANLVFAGAATITNDQLPAGVEELFAVTSASITQCQVTRDGVPVVDGTWAAIDAASDAANRVETGITFVEVIAPRTPFLQNVSQTLMKITTSGAIAEQVICYFAAAPYNNN